MLLIITGCNRQEDQLSDFENIKQEASKYISIQQNVEFEQDIDFYVEGVALSDSNKATVLYTSKTFQREGHNLHVQCLFPAITGGGGTTGQKTFSFTSPVEDKIVLHLYFNQTFGGNEEVYQITIDLLDRKIIKKDGSVQSPGVYGIGSFMAGTPIQRITTSTINSKT